ncbi:uncharacterized protein LOC142543150 isoform X2 [Primulina tabacum]|uniref:uncharacterized protein LOC142543150 isoform X2 n=1 Tax=Primulina tabacum TaxID=48773 RepID=UPI003F5AC977
MLTLLILGPKQSGNDIDLYLEPLVEDLKELWDTSVEAYDAFSKSMFNLKAILMWTINDFPAYGNLDGCASKGKFGCPICGEDICSMWLKYSRKFAYLGHKRFLATNHPFRQKKKWFNGKKESEGKPRLLNGLELTDALKDIENDWGKKQKGETVNTLRKKRKKHDNSKEVQKPVQRWKKKSIFFRFAILECKLFCTLFINFCKFFYIFFILQENISNRLSRMESNNSANSSHDLHGKEPMDDEKTNKKKRRGASNLKMVSGQDKCKELERNEFGQPVGDNSVKYASFLGCMLKEFVPYTLDGWNDISEEVKDTMWSCLQLTYEVVKRNQFFESWLNCGAIGNPNSRYLYDKLIQVD